MGLLNVPLFDLVTIVDALSYYGMKITSLALAVFGNPMQKN